MSTSKFTTIDTGNTNAMFYHTAACASPANINFNDVDFTNIKGYISVLSVSGATAPTCDVTF